MKRNSAIENLFYGNIRGADSTKISKTSKGIMEKLNNLYDKICEETKTTPEIIKLFKQYDNCYSELLSEDCKDYYIDGFRFGILLGMDIENTNFDE